VCAQTILNLAGATIPTDRTIDGIDMHDVLFGQGPTKRTEFLYFEWRTAILMVCVHPSRFCCDSNDCVYRR